MPTPKAPQTDPWEEAAKNFTPQQGGPAPTEGGDGWKIWQRDAAPAQTINTPGQMLSATGKMAGSLFGGIGAGVIHTMSSGDEWARKHLPAVFTNRNLGFGGPADLEKVKELATPPQNALGKLGYGAEQTGEFFIPGQAEEVLAAKLPMLGKLAKPLARMAGAETVNHAQGGPTGAGAAGAGIGEGLAAGMKRLAPFAAETAMRIGTKDRAFGKTPGQAILDDTRGIRPSTVGQSAQDTTTRLVREYRNMAHNSPAMVDLDPARAEITGPQQQAVTQNAAGVHGQLQPMLDTLSTRFNTGQPISRMVPAEEALDLKQGFGKEHLGAWNPDLHKSTIAAGRNAYHAVDQGLDAVLPQGAEMNQRISSLIPVIRSADKLERAPSFLQRTAGRVAAHTGALTGAGIGAVTGYREGGVGGAVAGGTAGLLLPEIVASPETQMAMARTLGSKGLQKAATPLAAAGTSKLAKLIQDLRSRQ